MVDRAYAACLALADWCGRRRLLVAAIGGPVYLLVLVCVGSVVLQQSPNSGDEYAYLYQAATLAEGRLSNAAPRVPEAFASNYITQRGDARGSITNRSCSSSSSLRATGSARMILRMRVAERGRCLPPWR